MQSAGPYPLTPGLAVALAPPFALQVVGALLTNQSPYQVAVSIDGDRQWLAPYTSDFYPIQGNFTADVIVTPQNTLSAGNSANLYVSWVSPTDKLPGTYPAALTPQSLAAQTLLFEDSGLSVGTLFSETITLPVTTRSVLAIFEVPGLDQFTEATILITVGGITYASPGTPTAIQQLYVPVYQSASPTIGVSVVTTGTASGWTFNLIALPDVAISGSSAFPLQVVEVADANSNGTGDTPVSVGPTPTGVNFTPAPPAGFLTELTTDVSVNGNMTSGNEGGLNVNGTYIAFQAWEWPATTQYPAVYFFVKGFRTNQPILAKATGTGLTFSGAYRLIPLSA